MIDSTVVLGISGLSPLVREKITLFALSAVSSIVTFFAQHQGGSVAPSETFPLKIRMANALVSYVHYIEKMIWPHDLAVFYPHPGNTLSSWQVARACLLLAGLSFLVGHCGELLTLLLAGFGISEHLFL